MASVFHLYSSEGCHLCEQALDLCGELGLLEHIKVVDIVDDEKLVEVYGIHIPVLERLLDNKKLFWPFTKEQIEELSA